jgi:hypothetical protein
MDLHNPGLESLPTLDAVNFTDAVDWVTINLKTEEEIASTGQECWHDSHIL